jgi:hypothetical protein
LLLATGLSRTVVCFSFLPRLMSSRSGFRFDFLLRFEWFLFLLSSLRVVDPGIRWLFLEECWIFLY